MMWALVTVTTSSSPTTVMERSQKTNSSSFLAQDVRVSGQWSIFILGIGVITCKQNRQGKTTKGENNEPTKQTS